MNFSPDRDLLVYEPTLFNDVPWVSQQRVSVSDGNVTGTTVMSAEADFESAQVEAGAVVLVNKTPFEVVARMVRAKFDTGIDGRRVDRELCLQGLFQVAWIEAQTPFGSDEARFELFFSCGEFRHGERAAVIEDTVFSARSPERARHASRWSHGDRALRQGIACPFRAAAGCKRLCIC